MINRKEEAEKFRSILGLDSVSVLNIYGESGIGKTSFIKQLMENDSNKSQMVCGYLDFGHFRTPPENKMIDTLYDLCDQLKIVSNFKPADFMIADYVDSKRSKRIPYSERTTPISDSGIFNTVLDISDIASQFIDLTYLGVGLKAWKITMSTYQKYKPASPEEKERYKYYNSMDDRTLRDSLPNALAADLTNLQGKKHRRIVMFLDNINNSASELEQNNHKWVNKLLERPESGILWVVVTRKPLTDISEGVVSLEISTIPGKQMREYLQEYLGNVSDIDRIVKLSGGSPFYLQRILALIREKGGFVESDWKRLESRERYYIAREYIENLPSDMSDVLFMLAYAIEFDKSLFHILFPERIFERNTEWFHSSTFEHTNERFRVQNSMKDLILKYLAEMNPNIEKECCDRLFDAERQRIMQISYEGVADISNHLNHMCYYARKGGNIRKYFRALTELKRIILSTGNTAIYNNEINYLLDNCETQEDIQLSILLEAALLAYYRADYDKAKLHCNLGRSISIKNQRANMEFQFLAILIDIAHIAPSDSENACQQVINLSDEFLELLERQKTTISYKVYIANKLNVYLRLARAYTTNRNFDMAEEFFQYFFEILSVEKANALSLNDLYARAHEMLGNLYGQMGKHEAEIQIEEKAIDAYNIAEVMQQVWDPEFYLNFGLAYKRLGESCLREGKIEKGLAFIDAALSKYQIVKKNAPDIIDVYCKIGFAYNDAAQYLLKYPEYISKADEYLHSAERTANEAIAILDELNTTTTNGNRQLCSIRCTAASLLGTMMASQNQYKKAEEFFQKALEYGRLYILEAPTHHYSFLGNARIYSAYAEFLSGIHHGQEAEKAAECGMEALVKARNLIDDKNSFQEEFEKLKQFRTDTHS